MNGRVYDPLVSRFLSPDLFVPAPGKPQSFNRYAYVFNNPLSFIDPSGYIGIPQQYFEGPMGVDNSWFWMNHNLGNHGFGGGGHWSHQTNPKGFNFGFLGPSAFDRLYGPGSFLKMLQAESLAAYQADGLSVNASSIGFFFEALKAGFQFYILGAYGRESLVYSLGDIGKIILGEGGAITFTNRTASVHLDVAEVYLSGGGGITVPYIFGGIENSGQALRHYFIGNGTPVTLGNKTISALVLSDGFQRRHQRIMSGKTTSLKGSFSVNLKESVFHVGKTNVDYSISCANGNCTVTYDMFVRDGFWDPDFIDEYFMGRLFGEPLFQPDGPGPNLERFGGTPYPYNPVRGTYTFPNPGY